MSLPVNASDLLTLLTRSPLLKTPPVDIVPTGGLAPYDFFGFGRKFREADGAVAVNGFAVGRVLWV